MICDFCTRPITGREAARRVEYRAVQPGFRVSPLVFGAVPEADGPLAAAAGPLEKVLHNKCYFADHRRRQLHGAADPSAQPRGTEEPGTGEGDGNHRGAGTPGP